MFTRNDGISGITIKAIAILVLLLPVLITHPFVVHSQGGGGLSTEALLAPVTVRVDPSASTVVEGTAFSTDVVIDDALNLGSFQFDLVYDPTVVQVTAVTLGAFLGSTGRSTSVVGPTIDNTGGKVTFGAFSFGSQSGPSGTGTLATVAFSAVGVGTSTLDLQNSQVTDTQGNTQSPVTEQDGTVTVATSSTATPTPTATATAAPTDTSAPTPTEVPTATPTPTATETATPTPTDPPTPTPTEALTAALTSTPTATSSFAPTSTVTATATPTNTPTATSSASGVTLRISPLTQTLNLGQPLVANVLIDEALNLGGFEFELLYQPAAIYVKSVALGSFLGSTGRSTGVVGPIIDNIAGKVTFGAFSFGSQPGPSGTGTLATITFSTVGVGASPLDLQNGQVTDTQGNPQSPVTEQDGTVWVVAEMPWHAYLPYAVR